jgi:hypothetical protein
MKEGLMDDIWTWRTREKLKFQVKQGNVYVCYKYKLWYNKHSSSQELQNHAKSVTHQSFSDPLHVNTISLLCLFRKMFKTSSKNCMESRVTILICICYSVSTPLWIPWCLVPIVIIPEASATYRPCVSTPPVTLFIIACIQMKRKYS